PDEEGDADSTDDEDEPLIYTVTDVADSQVVLDGNHPLAGMALRFWVQVEDVRVATDEEIDNRHPDGAQAFAFGMPDDSDDGDDDFIGDATGSSGSAPTLH
ncbi:MAG: peptidylprolyl isomerase, partial [Polynucleobacter sp. 39-45-136]